MLAELTVFNTFFPGGLDDSNIKFRAVQWACSEVFLLLAILSNLMSRELPCCRTLNRLLTVLVVPLRDQNSLTVRLDLQGVGTYYLHRLHAYGRLAPGRSVEDVRLPVGQVGLHRVLQRIRRGESTILPRDSLHRS